MLFCGCSEPTGAPADAGADRTLTLRADPEINVNPSESRDVLFLLVNARGAPVSDGVVQFSIVDDPPFSEAKGATLSHGTGVTDVQGRVLLQILAGNPTFFKIRASTARAPDVFVVVFVSSGAHAAAEIVPVVAPDSGDSFEGINTVRLIFHDNATCAKTPFDKVPEFRPARTLPIETSALFSSISTDKPHAVVGLGLDGAGIVQMRGCIDLPGAILLLQEPIRVFLPLLPWRPTPDGRYRAQSYLRLTTMPRAATQIAEAWGDLSACPSDPARLWLDCTIDALGGTSASDPLDCRPGPDDDRAFGGRLAARRGTAASVGMRCRNGQDAAGKPSLDVIVERLFGMPRAPIATALDALARDAGRPFMEFRLTSTLRITPAATGQFSIEHKLESVELTARPDEKISIDLNTLGLPGQQAKFVNAQLRRNELRISDHGFTLRPGLLARLGFIRTSLRSRGAPQDVGAFVTALFSTATVTAGPQPTAGCGALDAVVCADLGESSGCLGMACIQGLSTLTRHLEGSFSALDGEDLDFHMQGVVPVVDRDNDKVAEALGGLSGVVSPGVWIGEVRSRAGNTPVTGFWAADRMR